MQYLIEFITARDNFYLELRELGVSETGIDVYEFHLVPLFDLHDSANEMIEEYDLGDTMKVWTDGFYKIYR